MRTKTHNVRTLIAVLFLLFIGTNSLMAQSGITGDLTWTLDNNTLTISGTGVMENYSVSETPWRKYNSSIQYVIIGDGVLSIGDYAFYSCTSLISITIPESVGSIGSKAFAYCSRLASITIPEGVTRIGNMAF